MMDRGASYHYTATNAPQDTTAAVCERVSLCCLCPLIVNVDHTSFTVNYHRLKLSQSHQQDGGVAPGHQLMLSPQDNIVAEIHKELTCIEIYTMKIYV